jgi:hypothetical protein
MIIAMRVIKIDNIEGSNILKSYTFEAPNIETIIVVANDTYLYNLDDIVSVAQVGTVLSNGTIVSSKFIFGIESKGIALGPIDSDAGTIIGDDIIFLD